MSRYGVNRNRLFVKPRATFFYLVFNLDRPLFSRNAKLRRAINYALDRLNGAPVRKQVEQVGSPTDQILRRGCRATGNWISTRSRGRT